jgi:putative hemolysin
MDGSAFLGLFVLVFFVAANGFFVATELSMVASRRSRLEQMAAEGRGGAQAAQQMIRRLSTYIAACQMGITVASLALGWVGEPAMAHVMEPPIEFVVGALAPAAAHAVSIGISFAAITILHIVFGEVVPKRLAIRGPEQTAVWLARPMQVFEFVFHWPIALLNTLSNIVLRVMGMQPAHEHEQVHSVEELRLLVTGSREAGMVEASEARIATRAFTFADLTAGALMTPRTEVDAAPVGIGLVELLARVGSLSRTQLPVYERSLDNVVGVLHVGDLLRAVGEMVTAETPQPEAVQGFDLRSLLRPVLAFPESKPADEVLDEMRAARRYFAVVIDEYGGTAGILTLQDLLASLVGPIEERLPGETTFTPTEIVSPQPDGSLLLDGLTRLDEWREATGIPLTDEDEEAAETLGGVVMARLGRIPEVGDDVLVGGRRLRVEELDGKRVALLRLLPFEHSGKESRVHEAGTGSTPIGATPPATPSGAPDAGSAGAASA